MSFLTNKMFIVILGIIERILKSISCLIFVFIFGILCGMVSGSKLMDNQYEEKEKYDRQELLKTLDVLYKDIHNVKEDMERYHQEHIEEIHVN